MEDLEKDLIKIFMKHGILIDTKIAQKLNKIVKKNLKKIGT